MTFVDGSMRTTGYNLASDMISYTDENGSLFANAFDPLGRKVAMTITRALGVEGTTAQSTDDAVTTDNPGCSTFSPEDRMTRRRHFTTTGRGTTSRGWGGSSAGIRLGILVA